MKSKVYKRNCLTYLKAQKDKSLDCLISDPPYGIDFMGKGWDKVLPDVKIWEQSYRVLKDDGVAVVMSSTRTVHRLIKQMEDIGFKLVNIKHWAFGSGFPKATDLSKQFDKQAKAKRRVIGKSNKGASNKMNETVFSDDNFEWQKEIDITEPSTKLAKKWDGWKYGLQSLKPACEPICYFVKDKKNASKRIKEINKLPNIFYVPKCSKKERDLGLDDIKQTQSISKKGNGVNRICDKCGVNQLKKCSCKNNSFILPLMKNSHPTVKPVNLMRLIIDSCSFKGDTVYDPFIGSGTTGMACKWYRDFVGTDLSSEYVKISKLRIKAYE